MDIEDIVAINDELAPTVRPLCAPPLTSSGKT